MAAPTSPGGDPTDVLGRRSAAFVIDTTIGLLILLLMAVGGLLLFVNHDTRPNAHGAHLACDQVQGGDEPTGKASSADRAPETDGPCVVIGRTAYSVPFAGFIGLWLAIGIGSWGWSIANHVVLQGSTGASVGKRMLGLRVVTGDGSPPGWGATLIRWALLLFIDTQCLALGLIVANCTDGHRRVGDLAAGTYVVRLADTGKPVPAAQTIPPRVSGWTGPPVTPLWDPARASWLAWSGGQWWQWDGASQRWLTLDQQPG